MNSPYSFHPRAPQDETETGGGTSGNLAESRHTLAQTARETATAVKSTASETTARAKETAGRFARDQKENTAGRFGRYGSALHDSARSLEEEDPNIAWLAHRAAERLEKVSDYLRTRDFAGLREDTEDFARRHPAAFLGGMFALGLVLGNIAKASSRSSSGQRGQAEMETPSDWRENEPGAEFRPAEETPITAPTAGI